MSLPTWMSRYLSIALGAALWMALALAPVASAQSQESGTPGSNPPTQDQDNKNAGDSSKDSTAATDASAPPPSTVSALGSAAPLATPNGSLRWGDFFVRDFVFTQIYDHANYLQPATGSTFSGAGFCSETSLFQTDLAFNRMTRRGQIALQYEPRLAIINGNVYPDYSNQTAGFNMLFNPTARWSVSYYNTFSYFSSQNIFASYYVDANTQTGSSVQNNFLDGPGSLLNETTGVSFAYRLSPRTTISFAPKFNYLRTTGLQPGVLSSRSYSGSVGVGYQLSARQTVGVFFNTQYITISGVQGNTPVYSMGASYSRQMGPAWVISGSLAATRNPAGGVGSPWTMTGNGSILRDFRSVSLGVVFTRDIAMGYVTNDFANRVDGFVSWKMTQQLQWRTSLGSQRGTGTANPISAYYTVNELDVRLTPRIAAYLNYGYRLQQGDDLRVLTGHRTFVSGGIRWESSPVAAY